MRTIFIAVFTVVLLSSCATTKIYVVRHAEKTSNSANPELKNPEGFNRANALRDTLTNVGINTVYSTNFLRTRHTAEPAANAHNAPLQIYSNGDSLADQLIQRKNKRYLVVGHSNTIPQMIRHINLDPGFAGDIPDNDFDNLYIITIKWDIGKKRTTIVRKTYGAVSP